MTLSLLHFLFTPRPWWAPLIFLCIYIEKGRQSICSTLLRFSPHCFQEAFIGAGQWLEDLRSRAFSVWWIALSWLGILPRKRALEEECTQGLTRLLAIFIMQYVINTWIYTRMVIHNIHAGELCIGLEDAYLSFSYTYCLMYMSITPVFTHETHLACRTSIW